MKTDHIDHPRAEVGVRHVLELQAKLLSKVDWTRFKQHDLQAIIDSPRLSGAHFEEFLRNRGRVSLADCPVSLTEKEEIVLFGSWNDQVGYARRFTPPCIDESLFAEDSHLSLIASGVLLRPDGWEVRNKVTVHRASVRPNERISQERMLQLFHLMDVYSSTVPEAVAYLRVHKPQLGNGLVILNASKVNAYEVVHNILFTQPDPNKKQYRFSPIGGDIEDLCMWTDHYQYLVTAY